MTRPTAVAHRVDFPDAAGTPLVLIHGVGDRMAGWDGVVAALRGDRPVVRYDLRGHGDSPRTPGPYELADFVADHLALLQQLGIARAHVAGFSLGGMISQAIALAHPETVDRLVIMGAVAGRTPAEAARVLDRLAVLEREGPAGMAQVSADRWYTPEFVERHPDVVKRQLRELAANDPETYVAAYRVLALNDLGRELHRIEAPTLVLTGDGDVGSPPRMAELMGERIPRSAVRILRAVKHAALTEVPAVIASEIDAFLGAAERRQDKGGTLNEDGLAVRREVLGAEYVDRALSREGPLDAEFQQFVTDYCWGEVWTDGRLSRRERSLLVLGMTGALGRLSEFEIHTRGALNNGVTTDELAAVLRQIAVYCGVPAGVGCAGAMRRVLGGPTPEVNGQGA